MSKQSKAKAEQGYTTDLPICASCGHFTSHKAYPKWILDEDRTNLMIESNKIETKLRCGLGGFAVRKMGTCQEFTKTP